MLSEARKRANKKYMNKENVKVFQIRFFPEDHKLYEAVQNKGKNYVKHIKDANGKIKEKSGIAEYIRDLLKKDLGMLDDSSEIDGEQ